MKKKTGFTLIELLAVIVILAIIALIAVPVILNIIEKARMSAFKDTAYGIVNAGELYFVERMLDTNMISQNELITLPDTRLSLKGEVPTGKVAVNTEGKVALAINNGRYCAIKYYDDTEFELTEDIENCNLYINGIMTSTNNCINTGTCPSGTKVNVQVSSNKNYNFYVVSDVDNLTLIMDRNLGSTVAWYADAYNNSYGPATALNYLNSQTLSWDNIRQIAEYTYNNNLNGTTYNYGYQKLTITDGVGVLTSKDGNTIIELEGITRARLITYGEVDDIKTTNNGSLPSYMYGGKNYWTLTSVYEHHMGAKSVNRNAAIGGPDVNSVSFYGIRPVIELSK